MKYLALALLAGCASSSPGFEAMLDMDRLEGGKGFQGTWLQKPDGERIVISYDPMPEYFRFVEKRVLVRGETFMPDKYTQHVGATHIHITSIELADGEVPYDPEPKALPLPSLARSSAALRLGRWMEVQATLRSVEKKPDSDWCDATLILPDGTELTAEMYFTDMDSKWKPLVGQRVTVLGKLAEEDGRPELLGPPAICAGELRGCGMK